jgi:molybdopterin molybdotransferase
LTRAAWLPQEDVPWVVLVTYLLANGARIRQLPLVGIAYDLARRWAVVIRQRTGVGLSGHTVSTQELSRLLDDVRDRGALESAPFQKILCRVLWDVTPAPVAGRPASEHAAPAERRTSPRRDVRMRGFSHRHTVDEALRWLDAHATPLTSESVPLAFAAGRVLAESVTSAVDVPNFDRATMDGFAVTAASTDGATAYNPLSLAIVGDSMPGRPFVGDVTAGQAVRIMTGAPLPAHCDAVVPAEFAEIHASGLEVDVLTSVPPEKNVGRRGEDVLTGTRLFEAGRVLRPQDLGVLSSVGCASVVVFRRPRVRLVITGNELLPGGTPPHGFSIADANGPMLSALVARDGGIVDFPGVVADDEAVIRAALHADADVVIVSGGSSVGVEDLAPMLLSRDGELAVHGIAMRPSAPTGLGRLGHRLVFLLPGNPVSSLCAYDFFAGRALRALGGRSRDWPYRRVRGRLERKITSVVGRLDYARVRLSEGRVEPVSIGGASLLTSTTRADGFVLIDEDSEGFAAGTEVDVWLYA